MNLGQLAMLLRAQFLVDVQSHTAVRGLPFQASEIAEVITHAVQAASPVPESVPENLNEGMKEMAK
jgi:2-oxoglutarate ferredoxin oxidoreductase subunit alpha